MQGGLSWLICHQIYIIINAIHKSYIKEIVRNNHGNEMIWCEFDELGREKFVFSTRPQENSIWFAFGAAACSCSLIWLKMSNAESY